MKVKMIFAFVAGVAIGSVVTWKLIDSKIESKYAQIAKEEIESVVKEFSKDVEVKLPESEPGRPEPNTADDKKEYISLVNDLYTNEEGGTEDMRDKPYVISPDEFGENDEYDIVTLTHYEDGVLEDENGDIIEDVDNVVGEDFYTHYGEYEDDAIHIRNDKLKTDYEILHDNQNYADVNSLGGPYTVDE